MTRIKKVPFHILKKKIQKWGLTFQNLNLKRKCLLLQTESPLYVLLGSSVFSIVMQKEFCWSQYCKEPTTCLNKALYSTLFFSLKVEMKTVRKKTIIEHYSHGLQNEGPQFILANKKISWSWASLIEEKQKVAQMVKTEEIIQDSKPHLERSY